MKRKPLPRFENGYICGIEIDEPRVYAIGSDGATHFDTVLRLSEAAVTGLHSCASSSDGTFAVSGGAQNSSGQRAWFVARLDKSGKIKTVERFDELAPANVHFDSTGNLWVVGVRPGFLMKKGDAEDITVKKYSPEGALQFSVTVPYSPGWPRPLNGHSFVGSNARGLVIMASDREEIVFLSGNDGSVRRHRYQKVPDLRFVVGFAVMSGGGMYMTAQTESERGLAYYRWEGESWKELAQNTTPPGAIIGAKDETPISIRGSLVSAWPAGGDR